MDVVVYDDRDKRYVPLLVAICSAVLAAAVVGGLSFELGRSQPIEELGSVSQPQAGAGPAAGEAEPSCALAIERANTALGLGDRLEKSLSQQTSLMDELLAERAASEEVLRRALPPLTAGAKDRQAFLEAVTAYQQARAGCQQ